MIQRVIPRMTKTPRTEMGKESGRGANISKTGNPNAALNNASEAMRITSAKTIDPKPMSTPKR